MKFEKSPLRKVDFLNAEKALATLVGLKSIVEISYFRTKINMCFGLCSYKSAVVIPGFKIIIMLDQDSFVFHEIKVFIGAIAFS